MTQQASLAALHERIAAVNDVLNATSLLTWDSRTMMPAGGAETRGQQIATLTRLARDLLLRGTFGYAAYGHRDSTHLRWFTRRDLEAMVQAQGWRVVESRPTATLRRTGFLEGPTRGLVGELLSPQWQLLATAG